jgi:PAS domain S-box-containing protein
MILLDMRTLVFSNVVSDIVCVLVILLLWHQSRKRFAGTGFWAFDFAFQTAAVFLISLRGSIPDSMSMVLSNTLVIGGAILGYMGIGRFVGKKTSQFHNYVLLAAFACVHAYFTLVQPNLAARNLNVSAGLLIICFQCMWFLVYRVEPGMRQLTFSVGMVFGAYCLVSVVRIIGFITGAHPASDYFHSGAFESLILISYQILFILLTYTLILMVNKRLLVEVGQAEEKSRLLIKYAPSMLYEIDFQRPAFKSVNDAMCQFLGYTREELLAMNPFDFLDDEGKALFRERIRRKLAGEAMSDSVEYKSRTKDGREVYGVLNMTFTYKDGKPEGAVVVAHDITERKKAEEGLRQRTLELKRLTETLERRVQARTEELEKANKMLKELSSKRMSAQEDERKRISGELHDTIGSCLNAVKYKIESVLQQIGKDSNGTEESLGSVIPVIQEGIEECRRMQQDLRPSMLDDLGLLPTLSWFCRRYQTIYTGIKVDLEQTLKERDIPNSLKIVIYRVTQEGMNNIAKHSKADLIHLSLRKMDGRIELVLEDNGQGFDLRKVLGSESTKRGLGLTSMRERTEFTGGSFSVESTEGKGTIIRASWPC